MERTRSREHEKAEFLLKAGAMYEELRTWRAGHMDASFDEIANEVTPRRRELMGKLLKQLAEAADERVEAPICEGCEKPMRYKGASARWVNHREGDSRLERGYYYCEACESTFFPPGPTTSVDETELESGDDTASGMVGGDDSVA